MKSDIKVMLVLASFCLASQAGAQTVSVAADVGVSMGLVPVYELTEVNGCPQFEGAPSKRCFNLAYKKCENSTPVKLTLDQNEKVNEIMKTICDQNIRDNNGCKAELLVDFQDLTPHYNNTEDSGEGSAE